MSWENRPAPGVPRPYAFPRTHTHRLGNGLTLVTVPLHRLPVATLLFTTEGGGEQDTASLAGVELLTAQALGEGTETRMAAEVAADFERLGGVLHLDAGWTHGECGTTVLSQTASETMSLLAEVVRNASLPESGVERLRRERLADLHQQRAEPRGLADDLFTECCFAPGDRYSLPVGGNEHSVEACSVARVREHYRARYTPARCVLIVAGDVAEETALALAESAFGSWEPIVPEATPALTIVAKPTCGVYVGHRPDAPQSEIRVGHSSVPRTHEDFYAIAVMNAILGGLFNSRINLNLREAHAYTYGAFSAFDWRRSGSVFEVSTAVRSDVTALAITEILREIERMQTEVVRADELSLATDYLTGVFPLRFETTAAIADAIAFRKHVGLGSEYFDTYREQIALVTTSDVQRVAQAHLDPKRMQIVVVGDAEQIERPLAGLALSDVRRIERAP